VLGLVVRHDTEDGKLITVEQPRSPVSESFRSLRTNLQFASVDRPLRTLLVTSPSPSDGKSTIAANIGVVLAQSGKRVVLVDDSIVRGTTSRKIVTMLKQAGAREVHLRISSPPTIGPCFYGIDTPERRELIASSATVEVIRQFVGADSLGYLSEAGMLACLETPAENFCTACFSGRYPLLETESETLAKTQR
jgi:glutamine phosphoribosylpyrophosphate amidotransferase